MLPPIQGFWGKARLDPATGRLISWHPLEDHCLDVAIVFRALCELPGIRRALEAAAGSSLSTAQLDRLAVFALLHDVGKFNRGFQGRVTPGAPKAGHVLESAGLFGLGDIALDALRLAELGEWFRCGLDTAQAILLAAISHHGTPISLARIEQDDACRVTAKRWRSDASPTPLQGVRELMALAERAFPAAFGECSRTDAGAAVQHRFAGLAMLADWIASDTHLFPYRATKEEDRISLAHSCAARAIDSIGLRNDKARADIGERNPTFTEVFGRPPILFRASWLMT